jgi:uncharacterized protein (DUF433 family)
VLSGAPRFDGTRVDVASILLDLELGASVDEIVVSYGVTAEQVALAQEWARSNDADRGAE